MQLENGMQMFSVKTCGHVCSKTHGAKMFRVGRTDGGLCAGQNQYMCGCTCVMDANSDTCQIITTVGRDLYKINPPAGNVIVSVYTSYLKTYQ